jgi:hypothetical protein
MEMPRKLARNKGLAIIGPYSHGKIFPADLVAIVTQVLEKIRDPSAFTNHDLSLDASGKGCNVYTKKIVRGDLLGWILHLSYYHWTGTKTERERIGYTVAAYVDAHIRTITGGKHRLMSIGDANYEQMLRDLAYVISTLPHGYLPAPYVDEN